MVANSEDPDQTPRSAASDLGLHCLPMSQKNGTLGLYGLNYIVFSYTIIRHSDKPGRLAQSGASLTANPGVDGSSPGPATYFREYLS